MIESNVQELTSQDAAKKIGVLVKYLFSKWIIIGLIAFFGGVLGVTYAWLMDDKYEATTTFSIEEDKAGAAIGLAGIAAQFGINIGGTDDIFSGENVLALMYSQRIIQSALFSKMNYKGREESLINVYLEITKLRKWMDNNNELRNVKFPIGQDRSTYSRLQDSMLILITQGISKNAILAIRPDKKLDIFSLTCQSSDESFSVALCNQILNNVTEFYTTSKTQKAKQTVDILQRRADSLYKEYTIALGGRAQLADANINPAFQMPLVGIQRKQTDITVLGAAYTELVKNLELAKFDLLRKTPLIQVVDSPQTPILNKKLGRLLGGILFAFMFGVLSLILYTIKFMMKEPIANTKLS